MAKRKQGPSGPSETDLRLALTSALANAAPHGGATVSRLAEGIRIGWGLDVTDGAVQRALLGALLRGTAERVPGEQWPTYRPRQVKGAP